MSQLVENRSPSPGLEKQPSLEIEAKHISGYASQEDLSIKPKPLEEAESRGDMEQ
jgi:hypothetical protein